MKLLQQIKLALCTAACTAAFSGTAQAAAVRPTWSLEKRMTSASGNVVIGEFIKFDRTSVGYEVDLSPGASLHLFAVSYSATNMQSFAAPSGWGTQDVAKADWAGASFGGPEFSGRSLGSFESLFGTSDTRAIVFTAPAISEVTLGFMSDGSTVLNSSDVNQGNWSSFSFSPRFTRNGAAATEFIAVNTAGTIIGQSIPEPGTALLGSIAAVALLRRRR